MSLPAPSLQRVDDNPLGLQCSPASHVALTEGPGEGAAISSIPAIHALASEPHPTPRAPDWLIWQIADSAFPTGGFAHSGGLEALWQHGLIRTSEQFVAFLQAALHQVGYGALPFVNAVRESLPTFSDTDRFCDAFTSNHVANRASRLQGQAFLASAERTFRRSSLTALRHAAREQDMPCHFAPVFGAVCACLGVEPAIGAQLFLFLHLRALIGSAVRLGIVGPMEGQALQAAQSALAEAIAAECRQLSLDDAAQTAPVLDLFQATQDRLYSRLFQS